MARRTKQTSNHKLLISQLKLPTREHANTGTFCLGLIFTFGGPYALDYHPAESVLRPGKNVHVGSTVSVQGINHYMAHGKYASTSHVTRHKSSHVNLHFRTMQPPQWRANAHHRAPHLPLPITVGGAGEVLQVFDLC